MNNNESYDWLLFPGIIVGAATGLYLLFKTTPPPVATPGSPPTPETVGAVSNQYDQLRDKFYANQLSAEQTSKEATRLVAVLKGLWDQGTGDRTAVANLANEIERFRGGLGEPVPA